MILLFPYPLIDEFIFSFATLQLVDDVLDYESSSATLGKPGGADLSLGLATGPALYAWEEYPEMGILIQRMFKEPGDVEMVHLSPCEANFWTLFFFFFHLFRHEISFYVPQAYNAHAHWHRSMLIKPSKCYKISQRVKLDVH